MFVMGTLLALTITQGTRDPALDQASEAACAATVEQFDSSKIASDQVAGGIAVLDPTTHSFRYGSTRGSADFYPASVVKLFFLAYAADSLAHHRIRETPEFDRGVHDMIVDSVNDAAAYVLEAITGATSGPELPPAQMKKWEDQRLAINRWYSSMGYKGVNACNRTWNEGPYGREREFLGKNFQNRNSLTVDACLRLMSEIGLGTALQHDVSAADSEKWCQWMKGFLTRKIPADASGADYQAKEFTGKILPSGSLLWSKAGYTDTSRHDVALVRLPNGSEVVVAIFTKNCSDQTDLIPSLAKRLIDAAAGKLDVRS